MFVYGSTLIVSVFFSYFISRSTVANGSKDKKQRLYYSIFLFALALPSVLTLAFRYDVGTDFFSYSTIFNSICNTGKNIFNVETGFYWLNLLSSKFSNNAQIIFIVSAILYVFFSFKFMQLQPKNFYWEVALFFLAGNYFIFMNIMRQFMAIAIVYYSFKYIREEKFTHYVFFVFLGGTLHVSVLLFVLFYPLRKIFLKLKFQIIIIISAIIAFPILFSFITLIIESFFMQYRRYLANVNLIANNMYVFAMILINSCILLYYNYSSKKYIDKNDNLRNTLILIQFFAVLSSFLMMYIPLMERILQLFTYQQMFGLPYFSSKMSRSRKTLFLLAWCLLLGVFSYINLYVYKNHEVFPYNSIFGH